MAPQPLMMLAVLLLVTEGPPALHSAQQPPNLRLLAPLGIDFHFINLNRSAARRRHMQRVLRIAGIPAQRWPAVVIPINSSDVRLGLRGTAGYPHPPRSRNPRLYAGTLGCRRSHVTLLQHLLAFGHAGMLHMVLEDDIGISSTVLRGLISALKRVPDDWDILRLDCFPEEFTQTDPKFFELVAPDVYRIHAADDKDCRPGFRCTFWGGTHAVLYKHSALPLILQAFQHQWEMIHVDTILSRAGKPLGSLGSYCLQAGLVTQLDSFASDRGTD